MNKRSLTTWTRTNPVLLTTCYSVIGDEETLITVTCIKHGSIDTLRHTSNSDSFATAVTGYVIQTFIVICRGETD